MEIVSLLSHLHDYCTMILDLEHIGNIPVSTSVIASLFTNIEAGNQKVRNLEAAHKIIRLKKGLYVVSPNVSRVALSTELFPCLLQKRTLSFVRNPKELDIWSNDYFLQLAKMIRFE